jgi:hypothetical protein
MRKIKVTKAEAIGIINRNVSGTAAIALDLTIPAQKIYKKRYSLNGIVGFDYRKAQKKLQAATANHTQNDTGNTGNVSNTRAWGVLSPNRIFVTHKGKTYIQVKVQSKTQAIYIYKDEVVDPLDIALAAFGPENYTDRLVIRDINMDNITGMRFKGVSYEIVKD